MSNNTFSGKRFALLWKQHFIQNSQLLGLSTVAYVGVIFFILSLVQIGNELTPHDIEMFAGFLLAFVGIAGVLYVGHSFPAFRTKEKSINYLMVPSSLFEKFLFELLSRIGILLIFLPLLYWITFHLQGYFFGLFSDEVFQPIGLGALPDFPFPNTEEFTWAPAMLVFCVLLGFVTAFTGAAMFVKQPLIKTLFALAVLLIIYLGFSYFVVEGLGVGEYTTPETLWLIPNQEASAFKFISIAAIIANLIMLFVAFLKLKEKEV